MTVLKEILIQSFEGPPDGIYDANEIWYDWRTIARALLRELGEDGEEERHD